MTATAPTKKRMSPIEIAKALELWAGGKHSLEEIAKQLGRDKSTLQRLYKKNKLEKGVPPVIEEEPIPLTPAEEEFLLRKTTIKALKQESLQLGKVVQGLAYKTVADAIKAGKSPGLYVKDLAVLKALMEIIVKRREEAYVLLEIEKFDSEQELENLPELTVLEVGADQVQELVKAQQVDEFGETDIEGMAAAEDDEEKKE